MVEEPELTHIKSRLDPNPLEYIWEGLCINLGACPAVDESHPRRGPRSLSEHIE